MTARPGRRRRRTIVGAGVAVVLTLLGGGLTFIGANAIADSTEGEVVAADDRPVVLLPSTDNAALAIVDEQNRLTSLVIVTLLPTGSGGSIVTVPVATDATAGVGDERRPLTAALDPDDPSAFFEQVEGALAITLQFGEIVGADRIDELLAPVVPMDVVLPFDVADSDLAMETDDGDADQVPQDGDASDGEADGEVVDSDEAADDDDAADGDVRDESDDEDDSDVLVASGEQTLDLEQVEAVLQSYDNELTEREQQSIDVALWSGAARAAGDGVGDVEIPRDDLDRPVSSTSIDEVFARLWSGPVQTRDLALAEDQPTTQSVISGMSVVLDRRDVVLVFAQTSPARVSTPNPGPVFRVEIPLSDAQLADSVFASRRQVGLNVIGQLLFLQANAASIDATASDDGASTVTRIEVANEAFLETMNELGPVLFGDVEVTLAEQLIDGIDVSVRLGTGYLAAQADAQPQADSTDDAATVDTDG